MPKQKKHALIHNAIIVKKSPMHGYGVFAAKKIRKGEKIEECYFIITKGGDRGFEDYYFDAHGKYAIFLGYGSIYNHADEPNADYILNMKRKVATIIADETIQKGEEIFISYGEKWFKDRGYAPKKPRAKSRKK